MIYVLDTNIILGNPSLSKYKGETVYIPIAVMKELDSQKSREGMVGFQSRRFHRKLKEVKSLEGESYMFDGVTILNPTSMLEACSINIDKIDIADDWFIHALILTSKDYVAHTSDFSCYNLMRLNYQSCEYVPQETKEDYSKLSNSYQEVYVPKKVIDDLSLFKDFDKYNCMDYLLLISDESHSHKRLVKIRKGKLVQVNNKIKPYNVTPANIEQQIVSDALMDTDVKVVILSAQQGTGKAEPNDTPIPTPKGWTLMGNIKVGDTVFDRLGKPTKVLGVYPQGVKPVYKIKFSDGRVNYTADEHLWDIYTDSTKKDKRKNNNIKPLTITTLELKNKIDNSMVGKIDRERCYFVQYNKCVEYPKNNLPVHPYVLGALLGDGCLTCDGLLISSNERDVVEKVASYLNVSIRDKKNNYTWGLRSSESTEGKMCKKYLKETGLNTIAKHKYIPKEYLESSKEDRLELLKGLMDTDGCVNVKNRFGFSTSSDKLRDGFIELCRSLGYIVSCSVNDRRNIGNGISYDIRIQTNDIIFSSKKHLQRYENNNKKYNTGIRNNDYIRVVSVDYFGESECTCIQVDNKEHLYLTNNFTVTHNTFMGLACGLEQVINKSEYDRILLAKSQAPLSKSEEIGWLTGDIENKLRYSMVNYTSNLEALSGGKHSFNKDERNITMDGMRIFEQLKSVGKMDFLPLDSILGASYDKTFVLIDEAQSLDFKMIRSCLTRINDDSKMVLMGDIAQKTDVIHSIDKSGLYLANKYLRDVEGVCVLTLSEIKRGSVCKNIAEALNKIEILG